MRKPKLFAALLILTIATTTGFAQTSTSRILGRVVDEKRASVAGATVTVTNEATNITQTQTTTEAGVFAFDSLPVGNYTVTVEQSGFKKFQQTRNHLEVNTPLSIDVVMEVGQVSEVVMIQGGAEQLQTANATLGNVVDQKAIETLPLNGRNPLTLLLLEPGVVQRSFGGIGSGVHVNGSRDRAYNVTIDGIEANESSVPNPVSNLYRINPDNVQEFKVTTNNATAEEGRNSGASISIATRSGTSEFHGTGFIFFRNDALNSNDWYANAQKTPKPVIRMGQYGFEVGGPIKKDKTFFFGSWQYNRVDFTQPIDQTFGIPIVYTAQARAGVFRYFVPDSANPVVIAGTTILRNSPLLVDPGTGTLRVPLCPTATSVGCVRVYDTRTPGSSGNNTLAKPLDSAVAGLLNNFPLPNNFSSGDGLNTATFLWNPPTAIRGPAINIRVDHNFNENNSVFARYLWSDYNTLQGDPLNGRPQVYPDNPPQGEVFRRTSNLAIGWRRVISPRVVNELTAGYGRFGFLFTQGEANPAWPDVPPYDFTSLSEPWLNTPRTARWVTTPQVLDNLSVVHGAHVFRGGINFRFYRHVDQRGQPGGINVTPSVTFSQANRNPFTADGFKNALNINASNDAGTLGNLINTLYGLPARISQTFISNLGDNVFLPFKTGDNVTLYAEKHNLDQYNLYFQDEWKVRPNLTLNYGARWEINPPGNTSPDANVFVASTPIAASSNVTFVPAQRWYEGDFKWAIGPRIGLAYSPDFKSGFLHTLFGGNNRSVIRLGYGLAFDTISSFQVTAAAGRIPGLVQTCTTTFPFTTITNGCVNSPDVNKTVAGGFPTELPAPSVKPSTFFTPPIQVRGNAPPITVFAPKMQLPTVHEWNLGIQRELPGGFVMQAAYIGRRGEHLFMAYDINQIKVEPILSSFLMMQANNRATNCLPSGATRDTTKPACVPVFLSTQIPMLAPGTGISASFVDSATTQGELNVNNIGGTARRVEDTTLFFKLRPNQQFAIITYLDNSGDSNYHAAQFTLRRRFSNGLGLSMAYTWGKSIDNQSVDPVGASSGGGLSTTNSRTPTDIRDFRQERARSDFDRTHVFTGATVWEVPLGRGKRFLNSSNGVVNQVFGGWTINTIFNVMSGEPFAIRSGSFTANGSHEGRAGVQQSIKPQLQELPGQTFAGPVLFKPVTLTTCGVDLTQPFCLPAPGQDGAGRNIFTAPSYWNVDLGFIKTFPITERVKVQFRTEMFNALNHANFDNPRDASVGSPSIQSSVFAQACCAAVAPPSTQTIVQTGEAARVIQFALKVQF
ncbi:MAG TPA: TonB-dependent receptor [Pyrinomonadaceae bacterium]|nr:TonB-dependent receptor [Pyrinomonadaceae bacterium]